MTDPSSRDLLALFSTAGDRFPGFKNTSGLTMVIGISTFRGRDLGAVAKERRKIETMYTDLS
jgi:hypothetical protein